MAMPSRLNLWVPCLLLVLAASAPAAEKTQIWREVRSPHFTIATNGSEKHARRIAYQFEAIRGVMQRLFPRLHVDPSAPIIVLVAEGEKTFQALEPEEYLGKNQLKRAGLFQRGPEKNYVLLWGDAPGDNPYATIYHEYTHLLNERSGQGIPLWLDEGLAQFYQNSEIEQKRVGFGRPSAEAIQLLRRSLLLPLPTLFTVNHSSPYYNEANKGNIFYAESWALTHYLMTRHAGDNRNPIAIYADLISHQVDAVTAAQRTFGDLRKLQDDLQSYLQRPAFSYFSMKGATEVDEDAFAARPLSPAESAALRGDFSAYVRQYPRARALLQEALQDDANCASAYESLGYIELQQHHGEEAKKLFSQAVKLNSGSYLAHYYFAAMTLQEGRTAATSTAVEESLRTAIRINSSFAPAYASLAMLYGMRDENLEEAHHLALMAVELEPGNFGYVLNAANILVRMKQMDNALRVAEKALTLAKSEDERSTAQTLIAKVQRYQQYMAAQKQAEESQQLAVTKAAEVNAAAPSEPAASTEPDGTAPRDGVLAGPPTGVIIAGKVKEINCTASRAMTLLLALPLYDVDLRAEDYRKVEMRGVDPAVTVANPCRALRGAAVKVTFQPSAGAGEILAIEREK